MNEAWDAILSHMKVAVHLSLTGWRLNAQQTFRWVPLWTPNTVGGKYIDCIQSRFT